MLYSESMKSALLVVVLVLCGSGCSTFAASRYGASTDNVLTMRDMRIGNVRVGAFTATQPEVREIMCRGAGPIKTPDNETFADYVRKALVDELRLANKYAQGSPVVITGNLDVIDFDSMSGKWTVGLTLQSSNGWWVRELEEYRFTPSMRGEIGCSQTAQALMPAVQDLLGKVIRSPKFPKMFPPPPAPPAATPPAETPPPLVPAPPPALQSAPPQQHPSGT